MPCKTDEMELSLNETNEITRSERSSKNLQPIKGTGICLFYSVLKNK